MTPPPAVSEKIAAIVGPAGWTNDPERMAPHLVEERGLFKGAAALLVRPASTEEVAAVVRVCAEHRVPIVPQGGNTGLVGGGIPFEGGNEIILNLGRMNRIRDLDPVDYTVTAEAGCVLASIQQAADEAGCLFPLSLAAEGSCQIGGNLSTNAGGVAVLRYGNARDLVLGLEVVLPDGRVWNGLKRLRKDNTGYDLKHLFIGGEGTLGIITAASLKLYPRPAEMHTALVAVERPEQALALLARARAASGDTVTACELMARVGVDMVLRNIPSTSDPFAAVHPWYLLLELSSSRPQGLREALEEVLAAAIEDGTATDAVIAASLEQRHALWRLRETMPEAQKHEGGSIKHDVSVPVSSVPAFLARATRAVAEACPGVRVCAFGHLGDGNIHYNLSQPVGADKAAYLARWGELNRVVHDIIVEMGGSISAEHGVGRLKRDEIVHYKQPVEIDLMRRIKQAFDPLGIMNPGKVVELSLPTE